jgi:hypothetical protein
MITLNQIIDTGMDENGFVEWYRSEGGQALGEESLLTIYHNELADHFDGDDPITPDILESLFHEHNDIWDWGRSFFGTVKGMDYDELWEELDRNSIYYVLSGYILVCE